jgi:hypothetical protein
MIRRHDDRWGQWRRFSSSHCLFFRRWQVSRVLSGYTTAAPLTKAVEVHYAPEEDLSGVDVSLIRSAATGEAIDAALYVATEVKVIGALPDAAARGCRVPLYLDAEQAAKANWRSNLDHPMYRLIASGGDVRMKAAGAPLMHLKGYSIQ